MVVATAGQEPPKRLVLLFRGKVPERGVKEPNRAAAFAMTAELFVRHQNVPGLVRIDAAAIVGIGSGVGGFQARDEALAQQAAVAVTADRVEGQADERLSVLSHIGVHRECAGRHALEADVRVSRGRPKSDSPLFDRDDTHQLALA